MITNIRRLLKDIIKSKSSKTKVRGNNTASRGINIRQSKLNKNQVEIYYYKLSQKEIDNIIQTLKDNGYNNIEQVPGIIIVEGGTY